MDRARSLKRGGKVEFVSLDMEAAEDRYRLEPADQLSAEKIFEARWALVVLEQALTVLGRQYAVRRKKKVFETLKSFVGIGASGPEASYEASAVRRKAGEVRQRLPRRPGGPVIDLNHLNRRAESPNSEMFQHVGKLASAFPD